MNPDEIHVFGFMANGERYLFFYYPGDEYRVLTQLEEFAMRSDINFTVEDAELHGEHLTPPPETHT